MKREVHRISDEIVYPGIPKTPIEEEPSFIITVKRPILKPVDIQVGGKKNTNEAAKYVYNGIYFKISKCNKSGIYGFILNFRNTDIENALFACKIVQRYLKIKGFEEVNVNITDVLDGINVIISLRIE